MGVVIILLIGAVCAAVMSGSIAATVTLPRARPPTLDAAGVSWRVEHGLRWTWTLMGVSAHGVWLLTALLSLLALLVTGLQASTLALVATLAAVVITGAVPVVVHVFSRRRWSAVRADQRGLTLRRPWPAAPMTLAWDQVRAVEHAAGALVLQLTAERLVLAAPRHAPADLDDVARWMQTARHQAMLAPAAQPIAPPEALRRLGEAAQDHARR